MADEKLKPTAREHALSVTARLDTECDEDAYARLFAAYRAELLRDPAVVLPAAESLLREADVARVYFFRSPHVHGVHVQCDDRTDSGRTLHEAYEAVVAARKAGGDAG